MGIAVSSGCPQGGVLLPLLRRLVDDSIARLNGGDADTSVRLITSVF